MQCDKRWIVDARKVPRWKNFRRRDKKLGLRAELRGGSRETRDRHQPAKENDVSVYLDWYFSAPSDISNHRGPERSGRTAEWLLRR